MSRAYDMRTSSDQLMYLHREDITATVDETGLRISEQFLEAVTSTEPPNLVNYCANPNFIPLKHHINYKEILWCQPVESVSDATKSLIQVKFVDLSATKLIPQLLQMQIIDYDPSATPQSMCDNILKSAYAHSHFNPAILIIINPHSGKGKAKKIYQQEILPILNAAHLQVTYMETEYSEHAIQIARDLPIDQYDIIACCSGDGIPHEIINGLYQRYDRVDAFNKLAITQLPCGSGNSMTLSSHGSNNASLATINMLKAKKTKLDLMAVSQATLDGSQSTKLSFLSQSYGIIADADIGTEYMRWLGPIRFELGVAHKLISRTTYPCDLYVDYVTNSKHEINEHVENHISSTEQSILGEVTEESFTLKGVPLTEDPPSHWQKLEDNCANNLNVLYVGKMPYISKDVQFFPAALPNDGAMDMVICDTRMSIIEEVNMFNQVDKGHHVLSDKVKHAKISGYRLVPKLKNPNNHYISVDGESFPFEPLQVEVLPSILTILLPEGDYVSTGFRDVASS